MDTLFTSLLIFGILIISLSVTGGLKCYKCSSDCNKDLEHQEIVKCDGVCTKTTYTNTVVAARSCSRNKITTGCSTTNMTKICVCNNEDLCNGSPVKSVPHFICLFMFLPILVFILKAM